MMYCPDENKNLEWDGFGWVEVSTHTRVGDSSLDAFDYLTEECERYGFVHNIDGNRIKISMTFENITADMGYIELDVMYSTNVKRGIDDILAALWRQAEQEIKQYYKRR